MKLRPAKRGNALNPILLRELSETLGLTTFVETGTYRGDTAARAAELFDEVHTIELSGKLYRQAQARFADLDHVAVHHGDSTSVLAELLPSLRGPVLLWLDAHYSEGDTAKGAVNTPILDELRLIANHVRNDVIVLIDDLRLFDANSMQRDADSSLHGYPPLQDLMKACIDIDSGYRFAIYGDVGIAYPSGRVNMSPIVKACTLSRLFDEEYADALVDAVLKAEEVISRASGEERETLLGLCDEIHSSEAWNLGGHYHLWRGLAVAESGALSEAAAEFERALELGCDHWRVRSYLVQAQEAAGRIPEAPACLVEVGEEVGNFASARTRRSTLTRVFGGDGANHDSDRATSVPGTIRKQPFKAVDNHDMYGANVLDILRSKGLWSLGRPLRLHLGCGETLLDGYVNIDYPPTHHNVMIVKADFLADVRKVDFPAGSVDEVRLHHVFEHFSRVEALAQLIRWHEWLRVGGRICVETPDVMGCARMLTSNAPWHHKMAAVRHLAGDQAAHWAYHLDHWFPERFEHTLTKLGFDGIELASESWPHPPHLANVKVHAIKTVDLSRAELFEAADELLWESTVADAERPVFAIWRRQLRDQFEGDSELPAGACATQGKQSTQSANLVAANKSEVGVANRSYDECEQSEDDDISVEEMRDSLLGALSQGDRATENLTLLAQAAMEVGDVDTARRCLEATLILDDSHVGAQVLLRQLAAGSDS